MTATHFYVYLYYLLIINNKYNNIRKLSIYFVIICFELTTRGTVKVLQVNTEKRLIPCFPKNHISYRIF